MIDSMPENPLAALLAKVQPAAVAAPAPVTHAAVPSTLDFSTLGVTLFPYQQAGVEYILAQHAAGLGAYVGDEMGLGKTYQGAAALVLSQSFPALVVCPP